MLTKDEVEEVYIELREGTIMSLIAKTFNVSVTCIQDYNKGRYYKVEGMSYPIVDRLLKYKSEPSHGDPFWDTFEPEPMLYWPKGES